MPCNYQRRNRSNTCDAALAVFNADDWLRIGDPAGHLLDGLAWLLRAAQEWQIQSELNLEVDGYATQVYAMDSVLLRARSLFEFFIGKGENYCHAQCLFGLSSQLPGPANFSQWKNEMHVGSLHLQDRSAGGQLVGHDGVTLKSLNQMPVDIAHGVLEVWASFENELSTIGSSNYDKAMQCRVQAEEDSRRVVEHVAKRQGAYKKKASLLGSLTQLF
jgi:hypothetical protein